MKRIATNPSSKHILTVLLVYGRSQLLLSTAAGVGATLGLILQTFAFARAIEISMFERERMAQIVLWLLVFVGAILIRSICIYLAGRCSAKGAMNIQQHIRRTLLNSLFSSGTYIHEQGEHQTAATVQTLLEQVDTLELYYARYVPSMWLAILSPLLFLIVVFPTNWLVGLILLLSTPVIPFYMALIGIGAETKSREHMHRIRLLSTTFLDYLQGMQTVRALGATEQASRNIAESAVELGRRSMSVQRLALLSSAVLEFFSTFAIAILAVYIGLSLLKYLSFGPAFPQVNLQTGLFLLLLAPAYFQPLRTFAAAYHDRADALAATEHLLPLLSASQDMQQHRARKERIQTMQCVELRNVMLHYPNRTYPALQKVNLVVHVGERVALVGPSGSGKTSLLALLTRQVAPTQGEVLVNEENCHETGAIESSWIGQRPYLFPGTLAENIALGQLHQTREAIEKAAHKAQVMDFVSHLPAGLDTVIGERGQGLSGGEAQRVALARAFLKDAPLLVLDEPTANLDIETEAKLIETLTVLMQGRIVLLATHRPALLTLCHRVLHVEGGTVVEESALHEEELYV